METVSNPHTIERRINDIMHIMAQVASVRAKQPSIMRIPSRVQMRRLTRVISNSRHKLYDPIEKRLLPSFAKMIYSIQTTTEAFRAHRKESERSLEEAVLLFFVDEEVETLINSFSPHALRIQRARTLSRTHYVKNAQQRITKLRGDILLVKDARLTLAYRFASFLCALSAFPFQNILHAFIDNHTETPRAMSYKASSAIILTKELTEFAQLLHRFAPIEWTPDAITPLNTYAEAHLLDEKQLEPVIQKLKQVVEDSALLYIIRHATEKPLKEIAIAPFHDDAFDTYFAKIEMAIDTADSMHREMQRQKDVWAMRSNLFANVPDASLNFYNRRNKIILENQEQHYLQHADIVENIVRFIDHIFDKAIVQNIRAPLLLKAEWNNRQAQHEFGMLILDMKELRTMITTIDQDIPSIFNGEDLFYEIVRTFNFLEPSRKTLAVDKFTDIDARCVEVIQIFRGISKHMIAQLRQILEDRRALNGKLIRNWIQVDKGTPHMERSLKRALSLLQYCDTLVTAVHTRT